jgi:hypothetical protein
VGGVGFIPPLFNRRAVSKYCQNMRFVFGNFM